MAFLVGERAPALGRARTGAGEPLIDPVHRSRAAVIEEIDRLLADTKPVL